MGLTNSEEDINKAKAAIIAEIDRRRRNHNAQEAQHADGSDEMDVDTEERDESNAVVAAADSKC